MTKVRTFHINDVKSGMIIGTTIEDRLGRHLIERGTVLNDYRIGQLKSYGIRQVLIMFGKDATGDEEVQLSPKAKKAVELLRKEDPAKVKLQNNVKKRISTGIELMYANPDPKELKNIANSIATDLIDAIESNDAVALNINDLQTNDEYTFKHSVDVATIAMIIAKTEKYSKQQIHDIGMSGLLHDIGKTKVPANILNKPGRLTPDEFEIMKKHSEFGYDMVKDEPGIEKEISLAVLQHHEKRDGSGYPYGIGEAEISDFAKILTVSDIYDALVTDRPYKQGIEPRQAVEMLMAMTGQLDMTALKAFLSSMILYPVDSIVRLSNGEIALVVRKNDSYLMRPMVVGVMSGTVYDLASKQCQNIVIVGEGYDGGRS